MTFRVSKPMSSSLELGGVYSSDMVKMTSVESSYGMRSKDESGNKME